MTVRELVTSLSECDPDDTVVCDARSQALLVIGMHPGMHEQWHGTTDLPLNVHDTEFLASLRIRTDR